MTSYCVSCERGFGDQAALSQHLASQGHAFRLLANQLAVDQKLKPQASTPSRPNRAMSSQSQPVLAKISVPRTYRLGSQQPHAFRCDSCDKHFKSQGDLDQHLRDSAKHKSTLGIRQRTHLRTARTSQVMDHGMEEIPRDKSCHWSVVLGSENGTLLEELSRNCHSPEDLVKNKYHLQPYSAGNIASLRKCKKCGSIAKTSQNRECYFHPGKLTTTIRHNQPHFTCCRTANRGCTSLPTHEYRNPQHADKYRSFANSPAASPQKPKFRAIILNCEMAQVRGLRNEAILICAIDYLTGAVLLNKFVCPAEKVRDWCTQIHGITSSVIEAAVLQGQALAGWREAREELWKLIDDNTILVGHALQHDLDVLRMVHTRVVDSAILAKNAVGVHGPQWGPKKLCQELLHIEIRKNEGEVHDCLEDVLATREVVLWCTRNNQELETCPDIKKLGQKRKEEQQEVAKQKRERAKVGGLKAGYFSSSSVGAYESDDREILHWSDIAEDYGWPHLDTGYDPWSN